LISFLYLYLNNTHIYKQDGAGRGTKGDRGKIKEIIELLRGYTVRRKGKERRHDGNFDTYWAILIQRKHPPRMPEL